MNYTNCPTCGSLCKLIPQPPKEAIHIVAVDNFEKDRLVLDAKELIDLHNKDLREILDGVPFNTLWNYCLERIRFPNGRPISWTDIYSEFNR